MNKFCNTNMAINFSPPHYQWMCPNPKRIFWCSEQVFLSSEISVNILLPMFQSPQRVYESDSFAKKICIHN